MNALEKIIAGIARQANVQAEDIIHEANKKAASIREEAQALREEWVRQFDETVERECRDLIERAESADRQSRRRALLETRNRAVSMVVSEAKAQIANLPEKEYFDFLFRLYEKNARPLDGVMRIAPADYDRIPNGFYDRLKQVFPEHLLELKKDMEGTGRGFVIHYGGIIQNCLIDNIFASEEQALRDKANEVLSSDRCEV